MCMDRRERGLHTSRVSTARAILALWSRVESGPSRRPGGLREPDGYREGQPSPRSFPGDAFNLRHLGGASCPAGEGRNKHPSLAEQPCGTSHLLGGKMGRRTLDASTCKPLCRRSFVRILTRATTNTICDGQRRDAPPMQKAPSQASGLVAAALAQETDVPGSVSIVVQIRRRASCPTWASFLDSVHRQIRTRCLRTRLSASPGKPQREAPRRVSIQRHQSHLNLDGPVSLGPALVNFAPTQKGSPSAWGFRAVPRDTVFSPGADAVYPLREDTVVRSTHHVLYTHAYANILLYSNSWKLSWWAMHEGRRGQRVVTKLTSFVRRSP